jgi:trimeric autotransporter adhesin
MSSTYSTSLRAELIGSGDQAGAWGSTTNGNFSNIFDVAIAGYQTVSVTSASQALTYLNGPTTTANLNQSVYAMLQFTTTTGAAFNVYAPPVSKQYIVYNNSGYSMILYNSTVIGNTTAAGTGVTVTNGAKVMVWSDGTNFNELQAQNLTGTLAIVNGGTGQTTANSAFNALAPSQTSANGRYLKSNGTDTSWDAIDVGTSDITGVLSAANGGTGIANNSAATLTRSGNFALTLTTTSTTNVTLPTTGTLATLAGTETLTNKTINGSSNTITNVSMASGVTGTLPLANGGTGVTSLTALGNLFYPVGTIYTSTSATNPGTSLGFGTWTAFGAGRMLIGVGTLSGQTFAGGATGGDFAPALLSHTHTGTTGGQSANHTHGFSGTTSGVGNHVHTPNAYQSDSIPGNTGIPSGGRAASGTAPTPPATEGAGAHDHTYSGTTGTVSADHNHSFTTAASSSGSQTTGNLPPYVAVYMWQRTA